MPLVNPLVSVIILNYNGESYLTDCIDSVLKNQYPNFEVILVDNASTDHSLRIAQDIFAGDQRLHIIQNEKNLGYSGGNNVGFEHCSGKYVLFLNNDTTVAPDWLTPLVDAMENDPTIGVAQSLIYSIDGKKVQSAGWLFSNYLLKKYRLCEDKPSSTAFEPVFEISFACGASLIVRRDILENMGAFDYNAPFFYDDTLISLKSMLAGKRVVTISGSKMYHIQPKKKRNKYKKKDIIAGISRS